MSCILLFCSLIGVFTAETPIARWSGAELDGGAASVFGSVHYNVGGVNFIYAEGTGLNTMSAKFTLTQVPETELALYLLARQDDSENDVPIQILLNDQLIYDALSTHDRNSFDWKSHSIPAGMIHAGENLLEIKNIAMEGSAGMPPWFMVSRIVIASSAFDPTAPPPFSENVFIDWPLPEPVIPDLVTLEASGGFPLRGTKGWLWTVDQYLDEVKPLAEMGGNFLMICYGSMCDIENYPWGHPQCNRWWEPLPDNKKADYEQLLALCKEHDIELCLSFNPNLGAQRILDYSSDADFEELWQHYAWMAELGMKWFSLALDDIHEGIDAAGQAHVANRLFERLRGMNPEAELIFCPTHYWGDGTPATDRPYLEELGKILHPEIYVFWTGDAVVTPKITLEAAMSYREIVGNPLIIWDNYPVNDSAPTLHLGPVTGRDPRLPEVCFGYMANPLHKENRINRLPLMTMMAYAKHPVSYNPAQAIVNAIHSIAQNESQQRTLKDLIELYPGMLVYDRGTGFNPVMTLFQQFLDTPHQRHLAELYLRHVQDTMKRLDTYFDHYFVGALGTLRHNIATMEGAYEQRYGHLPE